MHSEPTIGDAFGLALEDYYIRNSPFKYEIVERDDGYIEASRTFDYLAEYDAWPAVEQKLVLLANGKVLDIGCGGGRHSLYFQKSGLDVRAIDHSPVAISVCQKRGVKAPIVKSVEEIQQLKPQMFDTVVMLGHNLGLLRSAHKGRDFLRELKSITKPGTLLLGTTRDPYLTEDPVHLAYHEANRHQLRLPGQLRLRVRYKNLATHWFDYLFTSREELEKILENTGWTLQACILGTDATYGVVIVRDS